MNNKNRIYIIAEAGVNHNGSLEMAKQLIDAAAAAGSDAVKFQTFRAETLVSDAAPKAEYQKASTNSKESQLEMLRKLELDESAHRDLADYCRLRGIQFLSTPFDEQSIELLVDKINVSLLKIPSGEITNGPLLLKAAQSKKPIILSTGMSTVSEIHTALGVLAFGYTRSKESPSLAAFRESYRSSRGQRALKAKVSLLHCTTEYPAPFGDVNLHAMETMREAFGLQVGFSDHTQGIAIAIAAAALGATVIEKHFTLDQRLPGPDHKASIEPDELRRMVQSIREVELALGMSKKGPARSELKNRAIARKSLVAIQEITRGELLTTKNLGCKRPGTGIPPLQYWQMLGKKVKKQYRKDEIIKP